MHPSGRTLNPAVLEALLYWLGVARAVESTPVDPEVLLSFLNDLTNDVGPGGVHARAEHEHRRRARMLDGRDRGVAYRRARCSREAPR
jgi:hypothetical protein